MSRFTGVGILCLFFLLVFAIALTFGHKPPVLIIGGENSVGSWMSGVLLVISSATTAFIALKRGWYPWLLFSIFFMLLAIDENFMIHEAIKRQIVFTTFENTKTPGYWKGELPVIIFATIGAFVAWIMSKHVGRSVRWLIVCGVLFGTTSVTIDVLSLGILLEDCLKLIAELAVTSALVWEFQNT